MWFIRVWARRLQQERLLLVRQALDKEASSDEISVKLIERGIVCR